MSSEGDVFRALERAFRQADVRWYLFGAQAAILYGAARFTEDVDVTVDLGDKATSILVDALEGEGIALRVSADIEDFIAQTRVLPLLHSATGTPVDVVLAGPGIEELFFEHAKEMTIDGVVVPVASAEDLVAMKVLAGRPKDTEDAIAILAAREPGFDVESVRELLRLLEQALAQSDLLPSFESCLKTANRAR